MENDCSEFPLLEKIRKESEELVAQLGAPQYIDESIGCGYWKGERGIVSYRLDNGKPRIYSRVEYTADFINKLYKLNQGEPVE